MDDSRVNDVSTQQSRLLDRAAALVAGCTRWVEDFPAPGIRFADLTPVFADGPAFCAVVDAIAEVADGVDLVAGIDARGFLLGGAVARAVDVGVLAVRKAGKLPPPVRSLKYDLEYGSAEIEVPGDCIPLEGRRVLVVDDVMATGGTVVATVELLRRSGAEVVGAAVVTEIAALGGRGHLGDTPLTSVVEV